MPGGESYGIDLSISGSKDRNERLTPQSREWFVRRISRCTEVHIARLWHEVCPLGKPRKCFRARHLRQRLRGIGRAEPVSGGVLPASLAGCCHRKRNKIQALDIPQPPILFSRQTS